MAWQGAGRGADRVGRQAGRRADGRTRRAGVDALFSSSLLCHHSTQLNQVAKLASDGGEASSSARCGLHAECGLRTTAEAGRKEGRQDTKYVPTNSCPGAVPPPPRKVVHRCCSQFERIKETRVREGGKEGKEGGKEGRKEGRKAGRLALISPLLGASAKLIRPMQFATCLLPDIDSSCWRTRSPCHDK